MKCPICDSATRVLETRSEPNRVTMRVRVCLKVSSHRFKTYEVVGPVFAAAKHKTKTHEASLQDRQAIRRRDMQIASTLFLGWRKLADQHMLTKTAVYLAAKRGRKLLQEQS